MASAAKNSVYYSIGSIARALTSFLLLPVYANILGASQYGVLNLLQTFSAIVAPIMTLVVEKSIYRLYFDYKTDEEKKVFLSTVFWSINVTSIVVMVICMLLGKTLAGYLGGVDVLTILYPVIIYTYLSALITYCQIIQQTQQEGGRYLIVAMLMLVGYNVLALLFLFYWTPTYKAEVYATLISYSLVFIVAFLFIRKRITFRFNVSILKKVLSFTIPLFFMSMFSWLLSASDRLFIANYQSTSDVGLYSMAFKMCSMGVMLAASLKGAFDPFFFNISNREDETAAKARIKPVNDTLIFLTSMLFLVVVLLGKFFVELFLKSEYHDCTIYLYFLIISSLFTQQASFFNVMILQNKKTMTLSMITIVSGIISVILNVLLIPICGSIMAAINSMIVGVSMFAITWLYSKRNYYICFNFGNIWAAVVIVFLCSLLDFSMENIYAGVISKLLVITISIFFFTKAKVFTYPILGVVIDRGLKKIGLWKSCSK
jgi:O-antigen/teichoic acid export membrane protein